MLIRLVDSIFTILTWLLILRVIISWVRPKTNSEVLASAIKLIYQWTEPILQPIRNKVSFGIGIDLSPLIAMLLIGFIRRLIMWVLWM